MDVNQLFGSIRTNFPQLTLKPQRGIPDAFLARYELSEIQQKPGQKLFFLWKTITRQYRFLEEAFFPPTTPAHTHSHK